MFHSWGRKRERERERERERKERKREREGVGGLGRGFTLRFYAGTAEGSMLTSKLVIRPALWHGKKLWEFASRRVNLSARAILNFSL